MWEHRKVLRHLYAQFPLKMEGNGHLHCPGSFQNSSFIDSINSNSLVLITEVLPEMSQRFKRRVVPVCKPLVSCVCARVRLTAVGILVCFLWVFEKKLGFGQYNSSFLPEFRCQLLFPTVLECMCLLSSIAGACKRPC